MQWQSVDFTIQNYSRLTYYDVLIVRDTQFAMTCLWWEIHNSPWRVHGQRDTMRHPNFHKSKYKLSMFS
jgi:hypothetical protein